MWQTAVYVLKPLLSACAGHRGMLPELVSVSAVAVRVPGRLHSEMHNSAWTRSGRCVQGNKHHALI